MSHPKHMPYGGNVKGLSVPLDAEERGAESAVMPVLQKQLTVSTVHTYNMVGDAFIPMSITGPNNNMIPPGYYVPTEINDRMALSTMSVDHDNFVPIQNSRTADIVREIEQFWKEETRERYAKYGFCYKRGVLLYGKPGTGKSTLISELTERFVKDGGVVINFQGNVFAFNALITEFRKVEPDRKIYIVMEDIDGSVEGMSNNNLTMLLNMLDGSSQLSNVVWIATTNHPEHLPESLTKRPSRFDRKLEVLPPTWEERRCFLEHKLGDDIRKVKENQDQWKKLTEGMTVADLKEIVISVFVQGRSLEEAADELRVSGKFGHTTIKGFEVSGND